MNEYVRIRRTTKNNPVLVVVGAGGHAKVVADVAIAAGFSVAGFVDDNTRESPLPGLRILGTIADLESIFHKVEGYCALVAIGDNSVRKRIAELIASLHITTASVIHPTSTISPFARLGTGTVVMPGVVVNAGAFIGDHVILNTGCSVDHDCVVKDYSHISPGARLAGHVIVGEGAHIGIGACVIPGRSIGSWSVIGAGAAVVDNIPSHVVAVGVPARVVDSNF